MKRPASVPAERAMVVSRTLQCLDCGTRLSEEPWAEGLCPHCLIELALAESSTAAELEAEATLAYPTVAPSDEQPFQKLSAQQVLGERYQVRSLLGRGGMGEVWRAYDLKLRQDVALKALRTELLQERRALETLRQEVRLAREVISPNVCRVYDLEELDGQELVSMEYVDGTTLQEILSERGSLELDEAREIASQFLAGLEAIHAAGLVHRDVKPENIMITRTGRVVVMDFGIAKGLQEAKGVVVAGTPAYMSPEQARGAELDARGDLFSAGVVLAEMVEPGGVRSFADRRRLWEEIHEETPQVSATPWSKVITKAVSQDPEERFGSASALARALEEVTLRAAGDETARPYPGLAAFQQEDARYFFGRELEVEALWKKLRRPHLLAVIGPSGAGKSSFLRAGLLPTLTDGWRAIIAAPGNRPFANLARQLAPELGEEPDIVDRLLRFEEPEVAVELLSEWRRREKHALVVVDQFEELFTQNPPEVQERFAELLAQLPLKADLHVLLSIRDDFLFHCQSFEPLAPVFSEMTPLGPPTGASLRRALVEPALRCGYRFEEESMVEEMLAEVEGERGALPMVAFTAARLWEERDRETGYLTREAYEQIGGVGGALAQHAETTLEQIGSEHIPIVRELFRNLVTAQGTRATRDREELLSVFSSTEGEPFLEPSRVRITPGPPAERSAALHVLNALVDARLLTSYEVPSDSESAEPHHRIEIVHESLLTAWPRLVRWQMQDAEGAKLRDELRAQAQLWDEHGRSPDYLWTGAAYLDYLAWRERYPGGLSTTEEAFTHTMTAHAERRKRRRRIAVSAAFVVLLTVLAIVGGFWRRSVAEARRAEAAKLLALAQLRLDEDPTEALAYTTASLELADTEESRVFVMKTLGGGPPVLVLDPERGENLGIPAFSPDGRWLSLAAIVREEVLVWDQDGSGPVVLGGHAASPSGPIQSAWISENELITGHWTEGRARIWSFPGGRLVREIDFGDPARWYTGESHLLAEVIESAAETGDRTYHLRSWRLPDGDPEELGRVDWAALGASQSLFAPSGRGWIYTKGNQVFYRPLPVREGVSDHLVGAHENEVRFIGGYLAALDRRSIGSDRIWTRDVSTGELRLWSLSASKVEPLRVIAQPAGTDEGTRVRLGLGGRWLVDDLQFRDGKALLWDLELLPGTDPRLLKRSGYWYYASLDFHPKGDWIVASTRYMSELSFWPLAAQTPIVVGGYDTSARRPVVFTPDGEWLATHWGQDELRLWPLPGSGRREDRELEIESATVHTKLSIDPAGEQLLVAGYGKGLFVVPLDGGEPRRLEGFQSTTMLEQGAFSPSGRLAAAATFFSSDEFKLRVWDLETGEVDVFELPRPVRASAGGDASSSGTENNLVVGFLAFADESTLFTAGGSGVLRWDLDSGTYQQIVPVEPDQVAGLWLSEDRRQLITFVGDLEGECGPLVLHDLPTGQSRGLETFFDCEGWELAFDRALSVLVIGGDDGILRVGRLDGSVPHLLTGHAGPIMGLAISPDGRWIASAGQDETLRLWPMPDLDQPPLHTLPHEELLAKLKSLTNIRVVRDPESAEGWKVELDPFPGWKEVPTW